jgi:hypothetical protein
VAFTDPIGVLDTASVSTAAALAFEDLVGVTDDDVTVADDWITFPDGVNANTGATVTGLVNDQAYKFRVAAVNAFGEGPWSNIAGPYTPQDVLTGIDGGYWGILVTS